MDSRLAYAGCALFFTAYAQVSPLFSFFGVKVNGALVLAVFFSLFIRTVFEGVFLVVCAALGLASGIGMVLSLLFFSVIFIIGQGMRRMVPLQPLVSGCALVLFFSLVIYASLDWGLIVRLAPQFARDALYAMTAFIICYIFLSRYYARQGGH